jgi:hypothetical protein
MRVIEQKLCKAIEEKKTWKLDNTSLQWIGDIGEVYLYGNLIARIYSDSVTLFDGGVRSKTTKSRLNSILDSLKLNICGVYQLRYKWYFTDRKINIPFESGLNYKF